MNRPVLGSHTKALTFIFIGIFCFALSYEASAATRRMECREWYNKDYLGLYTFSLDQVSNHLSVSYANEDKKILFAKAVQQWKLLYSKELNFVFFGLDSADWMGPVKILSLDFSKPAMFTYSVGSQFEDSKIVDKIERECRRLD